MAVAAITEPAKTKQNATSSRSHSIFRLKIFGSNEETGVSNQSMINLVDLAGRLNFKLSVLFADSTISRLRSLN